MSARGPVIFMALMAVLSSAPASADVRDEFAFSAPIEIWPGAPLQWLELPLAVYRDSLDPALHDLRVLNGKGEVVPYAILRPPASVSRPPASQHLPIYPMRGDPVEASAALGLKLKINGDSTSLEILRDDGQRPDVPPIAFLVDARGVTEAIETLTFGLSKAGDFSLTAVLEASDDFANWRTVSPRAPLARLIHRDQVFENLGVTIQPTRARFWRLSAHPGETLPMFVSVVATPVAGSAAVERKISSVVGRPVSGANGEYEFDLGAQLPVDRLQLAPPDVNTVARVEYFARRAPGDTWRPVARAAVYRLQAAGQTEGAGDELRSAPLAIAADSSRYWRVVVDPRGGGLGAGTPGLSAGWLAHRVVFVARGAAPFELVYGNFDAADGEVALSELLPGGTVSAEGLAQPFAQVRSTRLAGGIERLQRPPPPGSWRLGLLWGALGIGVLSLAVMAWRLARQMRATP
jgi:hypothetical protein